MQDLRPVIHDGTELGRVAVRQHPGGTWEVVVVPAVDADPELHRHLLAVALDDVAAAGGGPVTRWVDDGDEAAAAACAALGLRPDRELWQMRRRLPVEESWDLEVRSFRPGADDDAWLRVNNAAFAWHPEQGGWTQEDLQARMAEPWFDPDGFLVHEGDDGELVGFCWTKVHADEDPPLGEIFVIGVHPDAHGRGLGRELSLAGLDHLWRQGLRWGMLYVDASNEPAVAMYRRHGFALHEVRRAHVGEVAAGATA